MCLVPAGLRVCFPSPREGGGRRGSAAGDCATTAAITDTHPDGRQRPHLPVVVPVSGDARVRSGCKVNETQATGRYSPRSRSVFPAHAGVARGRACRGAARPRLPRTRRGGPCLPWSGCSNHTSSPRTRVGGPVWSVQESGERGDRVAVVGRSEACGAPDLSESGSRTTGSRYVTVGRSPRQRVTNCVTTAPFAGIRTRTSTDVIWYLSCTNTHGQRSGFLLRPGTATGAP